MHVRQAGPVPCVFNRQGHQVSRSVQIDKDILKQNHPQPFALMANPSPTSQATIRLNLLRLRELNCLINPAGAVRLSIRPVSCEFKVPGGLHGILFRQIESSLQAAPLPKFRYAPRECGVSQNSAGLKAAGRKPRAPAYTTPTTPEGSQLHRTHVTKPEPSGTRTRLMPQGPVILRA
jgi:hypothetical protein